MDLEDKRDDACGATSISGRARPLAQRRATTPLPYDGSSRRDFLGSVPLTFPVLRALGGSIMPTCYRSDLSCPNSLYEPQ